MKEWRTGEVNEVERVLQIIATYRWCSYLDYIGTKNFPSLIYNDLLEELFGNTKQQTDQIIKIISTPAHSGAAKEID